MMLRVTGRLQHLTGACLIVLLVCGLYLPFLGNPPVFDDKGFFSGYRFSYYATHVFDFSLRVPPYFSLAAVQVFWGSIAAHRIVSLAFHVACSLAVYRLFLAMLKLAQRSSHAGSVGEEHDSAAIWAFAGAAVFAIHPVAVYGAAYLVQRSIVLATLFSVLSLAAFVRGLTCRSYAGALWAAALYSLSVFCKEHAVLLPAAAALAVSFASAGGRFTVRYAAIYLAACAPAAILVALLSKGLIGIPYEPDFGQIVFQIENVFGSDVAEFAWPLSAVTQAGLFFRYLWLWLWPSTEAMSFDLRVDFLGAWSLGWIALKVAGFFACGVLGAWLLRRGGRLGLAGFGLLYAWILFLVEFSVSRFQEPFVLYRSYLWAPGILLIPAALLSGFSRRAAIVVCAVVFPVLFYQAHDRLTTFSKPLLLWEDAAAKLPDKAIPWGSRTLYGLGREYLYAGYPDKAIAVTDRCMALYPDTAHCIYARGAIHLQLEQYELALPYLRRTTELHPDDPVALHRLGLALEHLDRIEEARALYRRASELGYGGGQWELDRLDAERNRTSMPAKKT